MHALHHSQEQMNLFTDDRAHPVDLLFRGVISFVPFLMFDPAPPTLTAVIVLRGAMQRFIHSNVKMDFLIFNYVLVSPQFHRVRHSIEDRHRDKNFGTLFSVWDYFFGTAYPETSEYPTTGIADSTFPYDGRFGKTQVIFDTYKQLTYPFEQLCWNKRHRRENAKDHYTIRAQKSSAT